MPGEFDLGFPPHAPNLGRIANVVSEAGTTVDQLHGMALYEPVTHIMQATDDYSALSRKALRAPLKTISSAMDHATALASTAIAAPSEIVQAAALALPGTQPVDKIPALQPIVPVAARPVLPPPVKTPAGRPGGHLPSVPFQPPTLPPALPPGACVQNYAPVEISGWYCVPGYCTGSGQPECVFYSVGEFLPGPGTSGPWNTAEDCANFGMCGAAPPPPPPPPECPPGTHWDPSIQQCIPDILPPPPPPTPCPPGTTLDTSTGQCISPPPPPPPPPTPAQATSCIESADNGWAMDDCADDHCTAAFTQMGIDQTKLWDGGSPVAWWMANWDPVFGTAFEAPLESVPEG